MKASLDNLSLKVRLSRALEALEDVDPVLNDNDKHPLALHVKADALYHLGNFEHALVFYQRGLRYLVILLYR